MKKIINFLIDEESKIWIENEEFKKYDYKDFVMDNSVLVSNNINDVNNCIKNMINNLKDDNESVKEYFKSIEVFDDYDVYKNYKKVKKELLELLKNYENCEVEIYEWELDKSYNIGIIIN